ncbi:MAG: hypothetical protein ACLUEQ_06175 [Cloacibacillus evryensis]
MKIEGVPYQTVDWNKIESVAHGGESGEALWRTFEKGNVRARVVEYGAGYLADHGVRAVMCSSCLRDR